MQWALLSKIPVHAFLVEVNSCMGGGKIARGKNVSRHKSLNCRQAMWMSLSRRGRGRNETFRAAVQGMDANHPRV